MSPIKRRVVRSLLMVAVPGVILCAGAYLYLRDANIVATDNAYVRADVIAISTEIDGRIMRVLVDDNEWVEAGQLLFEIDPAPFHLELEAAETEMAMVAQEIDSLRAQYYESSVGIRAASERVRYLTLEHKRQLGLQENGHGIQARLEAAEHELEIARQQVDALRQRRMQVIAELGGAAELPISDHPRYRRAMVTRNQAALDLSRTRVMAPTGGFLGNVTLQAGEQVEVSDTLFPLVSSGAPWIEANLKEVHLTHVKIDQRATVTIDSYPNTVLHGFVESISPATGAEFAVLPAQNATGNWVKVVQRVPIKIRLDPADGLPPLRAGMTATVEIDTEIEDAPFVTVIDRALAASGFLGLKHEP